MEGALESPDPGVLNRRRPEPSGFDKVRTSTEEKSIGNDATGPWGADQGKRVGFRFQGSDAP